MKTITICALLAAIVALSRVDAVPQLYRYAEGSRNCSVDHQQSIGTGNLRLTNGQTTVVVGPMDREIITQYVFHYTAGDKYVSAHTISGGVGTNSLVVLFSANGADSMSFHYEVFAKFDR